MSTNERKVNICGGKLRPPVNTKDDREMVRLGLRVPKLIPRDPEVFTKTSSEKKEIKLKKNNTLKSGWGKKYPDYETTKAKCMLVVYTSNSPKVDKYKSTHRFDAYKCEIEDYIANLKSEGYVIKKVYWNSKPYKVQEYDRGRI